MERKQGTIYKALAALVTAVLLFVCAGALLTATSAKAEGGPSWLPENGKYAYTLQMNVNGRTALADSGDWDSFLVTSEAGADTISRNNAKQLRTRRISLDALLAGYARKQNPAGVGDKTNYYIDSYFNLSSTSIDNQYTTYLKATVQNPGTTSEAVLFEALRYKSVEHPVSLRIDATKSGNAPAIAGLPDKISIFLQIEIDSSFVSVGDSAATPGIDDSKTLFIKDDEPLFLKNGETKEFDLNDLTAKDFYYLDSNNDNAETPLYETGSQAPWQLKDAKYLSVNGVQGVVSGNRTASKQIVIVQSDKCTNASIEKDFIGTATPRVLINTSFNEKIVNSVDSAMGQDAFWNQTHYLYLTLNVSALSENGGTVRIGKAVKFNTSGAPVAKTKLDIITDLNPKSQYDYVVGAPDNAEHQEDGFRSVLVSPSHIADYPSTSKQVQSFDLSMEPVCEPADTVEFEFVEKAYPVVVDGETTYTPSYKITAVERGDVVVTFQIQYNGLNVIKIPVSFSVYGNYPISFGNLEGKRTQTFRTNTAKEFQALSADGYYMVDATVDNPEIALVEFRSGLLKLTPKADGIAAIKFTFANLENRRLVVPVEVTVNYSANGFFVMFEDWQAWLIIAAAIVVGLGLILLIVWLFIRGVSKRRESELATTAPTSSYIIKLNSTIAAAQAQQRLAATQAFTNAQTQMLQLGAAPVPGAPVNTLQLGAAPPPPAGVNSMPTQGEALSFPSSGDDVSITPPPPSAEEIYIPMTDEELLERIYVEKYEPRGMVRRTFFKSKDLQARELEKEKERIREEVRSGTPIEEAVKSAAQREKEAAGAVVSEQPAEPVKEEITLVSLLGFDPKSPLLPDEEPVPEAAEGTPPEQLALEAAERRLARLEAEYKVLSERLDKAVGVTDKQNGEAEESDKAVAGKKEYAEKLKEDLTQLEIKLATAKNKDKDKINKDIENKEHVHKDTLEAVDKMTAELTEKRRLIGELEAVVQTLTDDKTARDAALEEAKAKLEEAKKDHQLYLERMEMAKKAQAKRESIDELNPMLVTVNTLDKDMRDLENQVDKDSKDKDTFKAEVSSIQAQLLTTNDVTAISNLSARINELNKAASNLDKAISSNKKLRADKNIQFTKERKKANEYIDRKDLSIEDVVAAEDEVIGRMALDELLKDTQLEQTQAEEDVARYQAMVDEFLETGDSKVLELAVKTSEDIKAAEEEAQQAENELNELTERMESASDDEKLMMSIDQMSMTERLEELKKRVEEVTAQATKEKLEFQMNRERELEELRTQLAAAQEAYRQATDKINDVTNNTNPTDLIISGSGVISQDRHKLEQDNLKKQLQETKNILEQANLQAKMAQMEAERKIVEAQKASDASKEEAERAAQEAIAAAEAAKKAAEDRAEEEANRAKEEIERAKREAEEAAEKARLEAEAEANRLREEAEKAKREAEEAAEKAKREAEEAAEQARLEAEEEANRVREEAEKAKRDAEEEAERAKREAEEKAEQAKREAEEKAEKERLEAEEAAERERKEKEERETRIAEKVSKRKQEILALRNELKTVNDEQTAKDLREKFYAISMTLDEDEKTSNELKDLLNKSMDDATHAGEMSVYKAMANKEPRRIVKKVTERVNRVPKKKPGTRPGAARPGAARPGARPAGARPAAGSRPGAARPGTARPGSRPAGTRPAAGSRPGAARPAGSRPTTRPAGSRPAGSRPRPEGGSKKPPEKP